MKTTIMITNCVRIRMMVMTYKSSTTPRTLTVSPGAMRNLRNQMTNIDYFVNINLIGT